MEPRRRLTSTRILLLLAFAVFPATLLLWWMGTLPGHHLPEVGREIFGNIPGALQAAFYVGMGAFLSLTLYLFAERSRSWERGGPESRTGRWGERLKNMAVGLEMRTLLRDRAAGLMHALIYYGFVLLFVGTVILEIDHLLPEGLKFLSGNFYKIYSAVLDAAALALIVGVVWAVVRRYGQAPWRLRSKTKAEDAWILTVLGLIGVTGVFTEAARIAVDGRPDFEVWSFVGYPLSSLFSETAAVGWHQFFWIAHVATFVWFLVVLPTTKLRHMLTSPANMFMAPKDRPKGAMKELPEPHGSHRHRVNRGFGDYRPHLEADLRYRRLHRLRSLHQCVPCQHDGEATRPARNGHEGRRSGCLHRARANLYSRINGRRDQYRCRQSLRAGDVRRVVVMHYVWGLR